MTVAQPFCRVLSKSVFTLSPFLPHLATLLPGQKQESSNESSGIHKKGQNKGSLSHAVCESKVLNWTDKGGISQCPTPSILLVKSWPLAKLPLNFTEQGLISHNVSHLICNCLRCMSSLLCHCRQSVKLQRWYTQHTCADRYAGENNRPLALAKVSEERIQNDTSSWLASPCIQFVYGKTGKYILLTLARFTDFIFFVLFCSE